MSRIFLLGAGASYGSQVLPAPPLINNFFSLGIDRCRGDYRLLWDALETIGIQSKHLRTGVINLEQAFSELLGAEIWKQTLSVADARMQFGKTLGVLSPTRMLDCFIRDVLFESNRSAIENPCGFHRELFRLAREEDVVISLNYDLIAEGALMSELGWNPITGYGIITGPIGNSCEREMDNYLGSQKRTAVRLLKAHGSVNWSFSTQNDVQVNSLTSLDDPVEELSYYNQLTENISRNLGYEGFRHQRLISQPRHVLVPPVASKADYFNSEKIEEIWASIATSLENASEILVIGFSFSPSDSHFVGLFRAQMSRNRNKVIHIKVIDPNVDTVNRISNLSPKLEVSHSARTLEEFVNQGY